MRAEVVLRTPEPMGTAVHHVLGHTAWITGKRGPLLGFDVLRARPAPERPEPDGAPAPLLLTQLVWALHDADARLDAGDPDGALAALSPARFDAGAEVQFLARRAEAWLRLSPPPGPRRFAKIVALARLLEAHEGWPDGARYELPIPGATWDRARLDELTRRAGAWLEAQGGERSERSGPDRPLDTTEPAPDAT